ncbi:MAG: acyl-CoA dehydrogenase family protein [Candidatus Brocadiaceae bacterium]|jgi:alkylation response protein AidB-like acyl-CoA dehydrogenase
MPNFFTDNEDILDFLRNVDLRTLVMLQERNYSEAEDFDYAPTDYEDAMDNYRRVLEMLGELAAEFIAPRASEVDEEGAQFEDGVVTYAQGTREALDQLAKAELMGFTLPRQYGGLNMPVTIYTIAIELVSRADASLMNLFGLQDIAETINSFADQEVKAEYLPRFSKGEVTGAMALTEPDAGSDLTNVQVRATCEEGEDVWRLNGVKRFITNGCAEVLLVLARSEPDTAGARGLSLFVCEAGPEVRVRRIEDKLGIHGSPTCELQFVDAPATLIGRRKRGLSTYVMSLMNGARLAIAAQGVGIAQAALSEALEYAAEREQFGKPIRQFPAVRQLLGDMHMKVETSRLLTYETAVAVDMVDRIDHLRDTGELEDLPGGKELAEQARYWTTLARALTPIAKYYATEMCNEVADDALQVLAGSGYMRDYEVERLYRDARITTIYEGTTQIQHNAAIGYVLRGTLEERFGELHQEMQEAGAEAWMLERLAEARSQLNEAVNYAREQDQGFRDLHADKLVESATIIYNGYLLLGPAMRSPHKEALAENYMNEVLPRVRLRREQVTSGARTYLDRMPELLDYA